MRVAILVSTIFLIDAINIEYLEKNAGYLIFLVLTFALWDLAEALGRRKE